MPHRQVHLVAGALLERKVAHVSDDADHAPFLCAPAEDVLADRILPRPERACHRFVDHDDRLGRRRVARRDVAAGAQRDAHRRRISVGDDAHERGRVSAPFVGHALCPRAPRAIAPERQRVGDARTLHAGHLPHSAQHFVEIAVSLFKRRVAAIRIDANRRGPRRFEAHVDIEHLDQAANQQAGADQEHAREGNLRHHERVSHPASLAALRRPARRVLQRVRERPATCLKRWRESKDDAGQDRDGQREAERGRVGVDVPQHWNADRIEACQRTGSADRQDDSQDRAGQREHDAFGQHLRDEPAASGAERRANRNLLLPRRGPSEQKAGEVGADDGHDQGDRPREHPEREPNAPADLIGERLHIALKGIALRILRGDLAREQPDLGTCLVHGDTRLQATDHRHRVAPAVGLLAQGKGKIQVEVAARREHRRKVEGRREHAHHGVRLVVEGEGAAHDPGIRVEAPSPEPMAQHDGFRTIPRAFLGVEHPPELRRHAEHIEEIVGDRNAAQPLGLTLAAQQVVADAVECKIPGERRERLRAFPQVQHVPDLRRLPGETAGVAIGDPYQLSRLGEG